MFRQSPLVRALALGVVLTAVAACSTTEFRETARGGNGGGDDAEIHPEIDHVVARYPVHGIDVSKFQGVIDWKAVAGSGVRFAYLKATEGGDRLDDEFRANWAGARAAGIPTGAYHFYYFCRPVEEQVAWFKTHVPPAPDALPPVLDMEWNPHSPTCKLRPPADKIVADMRIFLAAMEAFYGKKPIIYTTVDFHRDVLPGQVNEYPYWLRSVSAHPKVRYGGRRFAFWQYTATGRVPGVRGKVDRNAFNGSEREWQAFLSQGGVTMTASSAVE